MLQNLTIIDEVKEVPAGFEKVAVKLGRLTIMVARPIGHVVKSEPVVEVTNA